MSTVKRAPGTGAGERRECNLAPGENQPHLPPSKSPLGRPNSRDAASVLHVAITNERQVNNSASQEETYLERTGTGGCRWPSRIERMLSAGMTIPSQRSLPLQDASGPGRAFSRR